MHKTKEAAPDEAVGDVTVRSERGLNPLLARQIRNRVLPFTSAATIHNGRGVTADARNLLELLLLGAQEGDRLVVRCVGPDARAAHEAIVGVLQARGGAP